jgi:hypothetical protein
MKIGLGEAIKTTYVGIKLADQLSELSLLCLRHFLGGIRTENV